MIKKFFIGALGTLALIYMIYPSLGVFELIPDNIPFVGNLDEGGAAFLLLGSLRYFGIDLNKMFSRDEKKDVAQG